MIRAVAPFAQSSTAHGLAMFLSDFSLYLLAVAGALWFEPLWLRIVCSVVAGIKIGNLLTVGHDAAHGSLVRNRRLNWLIGVLSFLPCLYSYRMWVFDHHILHHAHTNHDHKDTYTPFTKAEFDALPRGRRWLERFYRQPNPVSFAVYYIVERWSQAKLFPHANLPAAMRASAWKHCAFVVITHAAFLTFVIAQSWHRPGGPVLAIVLCFVLPFFLFMALASFVLWGMHTHPGVAWYRGGMPDAQTQKAGELVSVHLMFPRWFAWLQHDVMDHPVHHLLPAIPCYRLRNAQLRYNELMGDRAIVAQATWHYISDTMRRCKLFDFERNIWLDFDGNPTSGPTQPYLHMETTARAAAAA